MAIERGQQKVVQEQRRRLQNRLYARDEKRDAVPVAKVNGTRAEFLNSFNLPQEYGLHPGHAYKRR